MPRFKLDPSIVCVLIVSGYLGYLKSSESQLP